ncbi:MAG: lamin tail domain-containing protein [Verrucomicrobia bacterium]|nr:lamin tail domain-containing protein [Verrucomicrobiota bacterium]
MKQLAIRTWVLAAALAAAAPAPAGVVIHEIMYRPESFPENTALEWIELWNPDRTPVSLNGWRISRGVEYAFGNVTLPAGGYLVVAADQAAFRTQYPSVTNVVGNWTGKLANNGETVEIEDAQGQEVDQVEYASEGDWAIRRRGLDDRGTRGWEWFAEADGAGKTLELKNPRLPNEYGQNWGASLVVNGTPGGPNSLHTPNTPPLILDVRHSPAIPRSTDFVRIGARLVDEQTTGLTAMLYYRDASSATPPPFEVLPMHDDGEHNDGAAGDGTFGALLPPMAALTVVEFYVEASDDATHQSTWPAPAAVASDQTGPATQSANALYQVDDEDYAGSQPIYRIIMTEEERLIYEAINRSSDAEMNATFVTRDGNSEDLRYNAGIRTRGAGSRGSTPRNNRVNIPNDRPWKGLSAINLNSRYTHAQLAGGTFAALSGLPVSDVRAIQYRINGVNPARSGSPQYGSFVAVEPIGGEWAGRHFPEDGNGNVYRASRAPWTANLRYRGTNYVTYQNEGYSKNSNSSVNDWTDLFQLTYALSTNVSDTDYVQAVRANLNVEEALRYFAACNLIDYSETSLCIGVGDDYALYRGITDPRFRIVGHDFDTVFGEGDTAGNATESIWVMIDRPPTSDPAQRATVLERFMRHPDFAPIYHRTLLELIDTTYSAEQVNPMIDQTLGSWMPQLITDRMKTFASNRRAFVRSQIPLMLQFTGFVASATTLVPYGSDWKYLDTGADQGTAWRAPAFNDADWKSGPAQLGYGDGDEATVVSYGPSSSSKYITTYFRRAFLVENVSKITSVNLGIIRDDGAVVYLNGTEVLRSATMPSGTITFSTRAASGASDNTRDTAILSSGLLVDGVNVLAVEIHQDSGSSSDISFDLELVGVESASVSPSGKVTLAGLANVLDTRFVQVNGLDAAWTSWNGVWHASLQLLPGVNRVVLQAFDSNRVELDRAFVDLTFDDGNEQFVSGAIAGPTTWRAVDGPYHVTADITVGNDATLAVEPGTTVYFEPGTRLSVSGSGHLVVEGTDTRRIRLALAPGRTGAWGGLDIADSAQEQRIAHADFDVAGSGGYHVNARNAVLFMDDCTFTNAAAQYLNLDHTSFAIRRCVFPDNPGVEFIHGVGLPPAGYGILQSNWFGSPLTGLNDVIDFTGGQRPGAILQILDNVFNGAPDDILDLDGTDAWIEGNRFLHAHKNNTHAGDTASAISGGADAGRTSRLTIARNLFFDCDHMVLCKEGNVYTLVNNTVVAMSLGAVNFNEPERGTAPGAGAILEGNIIWNVPQLFLNYTAAVTQVTVNRSILPAPWSGTGNLVADPRLSNLDTNTITWQTLPHDFRLRAGSPATGTGPNGLDMGGLVPGGASISGEPPPLTASSDATLVVGGPGITHYRWKLNDGAYGVELPVASIIQLSGLTHGTYAVSVLGKNDAGVWQDATRPTVSKFWTVQSGLSRIVLNEVMPRNTSAVLINGGYPDWVELHNAGAQPVNLAGFGLSDNPADPFRFTVPAGTTVPAGGYLVMLANNPDGTTNHLHLGFGLNAAGDALYLHRPDGALMDAIVFGSQVADLAIGRRSDDTWGLTEPTPEARNVAAAVGDSRRLFINEWLASGRAPFTDDFVELYNRDTLPAALSGLYLTDHLPTLPLRHPLPPLSYVPAGGFVVFLADGNADAGPDHLGFRLSADQGTVALVAADGAVIDQVFYGPQTTDISEGRRPDGAAYIGALASPTPGAPNPGPPPVVTVSNIVVDLISMTDTFWRYDNTGLDLGAAWRDAGYSDESWSLGIGLFGYETKPTVYPYPFNTTIPAPNQAGGHLTVYYRTHFQWTNAADFVLYATNYVDDGAVYYINGVEVDRLRLDGEVTYDTEADNQSSEGTAEVRVLRQDSLVEGDNVLAVEVHQGSPTSSDAVFGLALAAVKSITNIVATGVVLNEVLARNLSWTNRDASVCDWVELHNPSSRDTGLSGMSLSDDSTQPRRWVFPNGVTLPAGGYLAVLFDGTRPPTSGADPVLNTGFGLNAGNGDEVYLFDTPANGGVLLDVVSFGIQAADYSIGRVQDGVGAWELNQPTPGARNVPVTLGTVTTLKINEWMADPPPNTDDWFELFNPNAQPAALGGLHLTDNLGNRTKYQIPKLSFIGTGPHAFVEFRADDNAGNGANHVNFKLSAGGESLGLFAADGSQIDAVVFGSQAESVSEGRFPDGSATLERFPGVDTPGASNLRLLESVVVNEVLTHTDLPLEDAIELYNTTTEAIDLGGWFVTDNENVPHKFRIPDGTVLDGLGYAVLYEYQFNPDFSGLSPNFALSSARGDDVYLYPADAAGQLLGYRGGVHFGAAENGVSLGRHLTSVGVDFTVLSGMTFGTAVTAEDPPGQVTVFRTGLGASNAYPSVGPIVVNEIHYHPPDIVTASGTNENTRDEFVELYNLTPNLVPLYDPQFPTNTWRLRDAVDFDFPPGTAMPAHSCLLVVSFDPATNATELADFRARYGIAPAVPILGPYDGVLANSTEDLELKKPDAPVPPEGTEAGLVPYVMADHFRYADEAPWPSLADGVGPGMGYSLQRRLPSLYANDPVHWHAAVPTPGAPNGPPVTAPPTIVSLTPPVLAPAGSSVTLTAVVSGPGPQTYAWRFNGRELAGATGPTLTLDNLQPAQSGVYSFLAVNPGGAASAATRIDVQIAPHILQHPQSALVAAGASVTFAVIARGTPPLSYQWFFNGSPVPGATRAALEVASAQTNNAGRYAVVVTNHLGAATSQVATLDIQLPPFIVRQPTHTDVLIGRTVTLTVEATGTAPLSYQWYYGDSAIPGRTSTSLVLADAQPVNAGPYSVRIFNSVGMTHSQTATLTVLPPPLVTAAAPDPVASEPGDSGWFRLTRTGGTGAPLTVYFQVSGTATRGADYLPLGASLTIPAGAGVADLEVAVVNNDVLEGNETVILTVLPAPEYDPGTPASAGVTIFDDDNKAPQVAITNLAHGTVFTLPAVIPLQAQASDVDGRVVRVEFFSQGTNRLGVVTNAPYAITWTNATAGAFELTAVATDDLGSTGTSVPLTVLVNLAPVVTLISPTNGAIFPSNATLRLAATAADVGGQIDQVAFYAGSNLLGSASQSPYEFLWPHVPDGQYAITAHARDNDGTVSVSSPALVWVNTPRGLFADAFAQRSFIGGDTNYLTGDNTPYTREPGEPRHLDRNGSHSAWITWTAPASGRCTVDTIGSDFDTVLAIYTFNVTGPAAVSNLFLVASDDDGGGPIYPVSRATFDATAGVAYHIAVDGYSTVDYGMIQFHVSLLRFSPVITQQPASQTATPGDTVSFKVAAAGPGPLRYQWWHNGAAIPAATAATLLLPAVQPAHEGIYLAVVSNTSGAATSAPTTLILRSPPTLTQQPQTQIVSLGSSATFRVAAAGEGPFTYQWKLHGVAVTGATGPTLDIPNVQYTNAGPYSAEVGNGWAAVSSQTAWLVVPPRIVESTLLPGQIRLVLHGTPGCPHALDTSSNLVTWTEAATLQSPTVEASFTRELPPGQRSEFYRVRAVPPAL